MITDTVPIPVPPVDRTMRDDDIISVNKNTKNDTIRDNMRDRGIGTSIGMAVAGNAATLTKDKDKEGEIATETDKGKDPEMDPN